MIPESITVSVLVIFIVVWPQIKIWIKGHLKATPLKILAVCLHTFTPTEWQFDQGFLASLLSDSPQDPAHRHFQVSQILMPVSAQLFFEVGE